MSETEFGLEDVVINQSVAILVDGNNIERSIHSITKNNSSMLNFDSLVPKLLVRENRFLQSCVSACTTTFMAP